MSYLRVGLQDYKNGEEKACGIASVLFFTVPYDTNGGDKDDLRL